jgi:putative molybdopterin biosynthesis protein
MRKVLLSYQLADSRASEPHIQNDLLDLLFAVRTQGSISAAARDMGLSYRHVWGLLKDWEVKLGQPLLLWERGQAALLTPFADKLLWTERLAQARLAPKIDAMRAELERTLALAFEANAHVLSLFASHDDALPQLQTHASGQGVHLDIQFGGSLSALEALNSGQCALAGFHVRDNPSATSLSARTYKPLLKTGEHKLLGFATRQQGLMVAAGNPRRIDGIKHIAQWRLRYVNRASGSGTRVLLDELLKEQGVQAKQVMGYDRYEPSHSAVALAVASGEADAGLGTQSAAVTHGLSFVPLLQEHYYLVCRKQVLSQPAVQALQLILQSAEWSNLLGTVPGYLSYQSGKVLSLRQALQWWQLKPKAGSQATLKAV